MISLTLLPLYSQSQDPQRSSPQIKLTPEELSHLLAPIALYPDALIAILLPATTVPSDVVLGARYLKKNGDISQVENQPWDDSVKSLVRYPDVLEWMDENLEWTASVGEAFMDQPADVMNAIQGLRAQAKAAGNLKDTPQQLVVEEKEYIRIVPADPEVIYVPQYDPQVIYVQSYSPTVSLLSFGIGFAVGSWLNYDFDWDRRCVYRGNWHGWNRDRYYYRNNGWRNDGNTINVVNIDVNNANQWHPGEKNRRQLIQRQRNNNGNARFATARTEHKANNDLADNSRSIPVAAFNPNQQLHVPKPSKLITSEKRGNPSSVIKNNQPSERVGNVTPPIAPADNVPNRAGKKANKDRNNEANITEPPAAPTPAVAPKDNTSEPAIKKNRNKQIPSPTQPSIPPETDATRPNRPQHTPKTRTIPSEAPQVQDQIDSPKVTPQKGTKHNRANVDTESTVVPERNTTRPQHPNVAPQDRPSVESQEAPKREEAVQRNRPTREPAEPRREPTREPVIPQNKPVRQTSTIQPAPESVAPPNKPSQPPPATKNKARKKTDKEKND